MLAGKLCQIKPCVSTTSTLRTRRNNVPKYVGNNTNEADDQIYKYMSVYILYLNIHMWSLTTNKTWLKGGMAVGSKSKVFFWRIRQCSAHICNTLYFLLCIVKRLFTVCVYSPKGIHLRQTPLKSIKIHSNKMCYVLFSSCFAVP